MVSMVAIENILLAAVTVFASALTVIATLAWRRTGDTHMLVLAAAFGAFIAKGLTLTIGLFFELLPLTGLFILAVTFDLFILALFYGFTLRR